MYESIDDTLIIVTIFPWRVNRLIQICYLKSRCSRGKVGTGKSFPSSSLLVFHYFCEDRVL